MRSDNNKHKYEKKRTSFGRQILISTMPLNIVTKREMSHVLLMTKLCFIFTEHLIGYILCIEVT